MCVIWFFSLGLGGFLGGEQKQTKKKTVKRNRDSCCCCAFTLAYKRKGAEGQKRLLYKTKLCYRDQNQAFKKLPAILFVQLDRRSGGETSLRFKVKICAFLLVFHVSFFFLR